MADAQAIPGQAQWVAWIEQQREALKQPAADRAEFAGPFKVGEAMLNAWRNAWTASSALRAGAGQGVAEMLAKLPAIGPAREQVEAWRALAAIQAECQRLEQELQTVLMDVQRDALDLLERRVREQAAAQQPVASYRELYDLWVDCGERIYAKVARSDSYAKLQAQFGNASIQFKARQQQAIEQALKQFDLPTRSELNSVHLQLRQLKQRLAVLEQAAVAKSSQATVQPARSAARPRKSTARSVKPAAQPARSAARKAPAKRKSR